MKLDVEKLIGAIESNAGIHKREVYLEKDQMGFLDSKDHLDKIVEMATSLLPKDLKLDYNPIFDYDLIKIGILPDGRFYAIACDQVSSKFRFIERTDINELKNLLVNYTKEHFKRLEAEKSYILNEGAI